MRIPVITKILVEGVQDCMTRGGRAVSSPRQVGDGNRIGDPAPESLSIRVMHNRQFGWKGGFDCHGT